MCIRAGVQNLNIAVIGSGYVGLVAAACFAELGHSVICVDNDPTKLGALNSGETPIHEEFLPELLDRHRGANLEFSGSLADAVQKSEAVFIAVGTPPAASGEADLSYVESVAREIAQSMNGYKVIIEKSTVPVYTNEWVRRVIQLNGGPEADFDVVSNPEFLREGTAVQDFLFPDRIVVGANTARSAQIMKSVYRPLTDGSYYQRANSIPRPESAAPGPASLIHTSAKSAELIKHASNAFLALKISFINAVANLCEAVDADIEEVCRGVGTDSRIGPRFLRAGIGYGGSCFPKDVSAFKSVAREYGYDFGLLDEVHQINEDQLKRFLRKVRSALWTIKGKRLAVLGLSFKGGTDDIRESPAISIVSSLLQEGAKITAFDPAAMERAREVFGDAITYAKDELACATDSDALLILTDWEQFASLDLCVVKDALYYPIVIDGRNLYKPSEMEEAGLTYYSVGRTPVIAAHGPSVRIQAAK
ncbi:MAG: UDP-glucose/GDP-mannose dehydrogenase family protein [Acidobacteriaceae bacterium]